MRLYLFRHGPAGEKTEWQGPDAERPLTDEGIRVTECVAQRLAELGLTPDVVVSSPYARSAMSAEILVDALDGAAPLVLDDRLEPGFGIRDLKQVLLEHHTSQEMVLVGHEPDFSAIIGELTGARVRLRKAGVARIDLPELSHHAGKLVWLAPPRLMGQAASSPPP